MAWTSGTATSHYDLLVRLKAYLTGSTNWSVFRWVDDGGATADGRGSVLNVRGPGVGAGQNVYVNISTVNSTLLPANGWQISASIGYSSAVAWGNQQNESPQPFLNLWNSTINYWFFVNDRRIVVVAQTSTVFVSAYMGMFLPWATPAQYPLPLLVAGDSPVQQNWSTSISGRRMMCDCGQGAGYLRDPNGLWIQIANEVANSAVNDQGYVAGSPALLAMIWPWSAGSSNTGNSSVNGWNPSAFGQSSGGGLDSLIPTAQGERFVWPTMILSATSPPLGSLDGVYCSFGSGLSTTATVTANSRTFLCFQNIARTSGNDFFLMEEV